MADSADTRLTSSADRQLLQKIAQAARERLRAKGVWEIEEEAEREVRRRSRVDDSRSDASMAA